MFQKVDKFQKTVTGGAIIIALFSILSRLLGLLRDRFLSSTFGAGQILDSYYAAFRLPDLIFNTLVLGALSSVFIPVFIKYWHQDEKEAWRITNGVLNILFLIISCLAIILFFLSPFLVNYMVPGFSQEAKNLTISLTKIMLLSTLFFTLSNVAGSVLNSFRRFLSYSLAPIMYNLGIIFGILFLTKKIGYVGLGWGVVLGALLHFLIQIPALVKTGYRWQPVLNFFHPAIKKISVLMLPRCFGLAISQFNFIVTTLIASSLTIGAVAIYNLAFNLVNFPVSIFGISLAISIFPLLSQCFIEDKKTFFVKYFSQTVRKIIYLIIPTTVLILSLRAQIVRLILGAGVFTWRDTILTAQTLGWFSVSLFAQSLIPVFARAFYATQDTKTPVKAAMVSFFINIIACLIFGNLMGVGGLAFAFSLSSIVNLILLYFYFDKKITKLPDKEIMTSVIKISLISFLMAIIIQAVKYLIGPLVNMQTFIGVLLQTFFAALFGFIFYLTTTLAFKFEEVGVITQMISKRILIFKNKGGKSGKKNF
ncbi:MAG: murein biosynthesis integral membrane protein MurJ [Patescibacteria group bacterium]|jgi:putative peptidoglycan lipid II flippase|nr:murein biosynthesis integral membrane protein MurJ [Patescibacteria group bacterium]MDD5172989.1 murein biosynthesis integral membrane protein MurJ [Patescibacteria group bacterium]